MPATRQKQTAKVSYRDELWNEIGESITAMQRNLKKFPHDNEKHLDNSWLLPKRKSPGSVTDEEGLILHAIIRLNNFTSGLEICTGFGYSTIYQGLAFKKTKGKLKTVDCYVEEWKENWQYDRHEIQEAIARVSKGISEGELPEGYAMAKQHADQFGLSKVIQFQLGVSPDDIPKIAGKTKFDYVLIDGGHDGEQPTQDWQAIKPFLDDSCAVVFHDCNPRAKPVLKAIEAAAEALKTTPVFLNTRWKLCLVGRNLNPKTIPTLHSLCIRNQESQGLFHRLRDKISSWWR